ncbi:MAG: hypothetical protein ABL952_16145, partial [Pyrinomonadaceae bacterium]
PLSDFVNRHPTTRMLALAFLVMIGAMLVADGFGVHVPHTYIYSAMAFAVAGLLADGETEIVGAECADVSFPGFFETLASVVKS